MLAGIYKIIFIRRKNKHNQAVKDFAFAKDCLKEGDLLSSSEYAENSARLFKRAKSFSKEVDAYIFLGEVYRFVGAYNQSYAMFSTALSISKKHNLYQKTSDAYGNLGMLMSAQELFDYALNYYHKALAVKDDSPNILNQMALTYMLQKNYSKAHQTISKIKNPNSYTSEVQSRIFFEQKNYADSIKKTKLAYKEYIKENNISAALEVLLIEAKALFAQKDYSQSEKKLRAILKLSKQNKTCFHDACAHSLLGTIYIKQKDYLKAQKEFLSSAKKEEHNQRFACLSEDYFNLGLVEEKLKNKTKAKSYFNKSLSLAKDYDRKDLIDILEKKLK